ncbi:MAG: DNA repair protein RecO [Candidatus Latescibacteria bacterium]|nr:DNA repair protein RecO [Candidatus Latescibacterota bacterium]
MISKTEGLVLRGYRMSESSKVVVIYTRNAGKVRVVARGARRPRSKFGASVEPITWGAYVYYSRENRELQTLSEGEILYAFEGLKRFYRRLAYASAVCDLLDRLTPEEDPNSLLCSVTLDSLRWMETVEEDAVELPLWYFQLKAAAMLGYRPHLGGCVGCGGRITGDTACFDAGRGGTVCRRCDHGGIEVRLATIQFLEHLQTARADRIDSKGFREVDTGEARRVLRGFLWRHIENRGQVKSLDFLNRLLAAEAPSAPYGS